MANTIDHIKEPSLVAVSRTVDDALVSRSVYARESARTVVPFREVNVGATDEDLTPDFTADRSKAELAAEQCVFLESLPSDFYVDLDLPDND